MFSKVCVALLGIPLLRVLAAPRERFGPHIIHEARSVIPNQWDKRPMLDKSRIIPVRINLAQNFDGAEDLLMEVSHPDSPKYAQHYNAEEVADLVRFSQIQHLGEDLTYCLFFIYPLQFAPTKETIDIVLDWLRSEGHDVDHSHYNHWKAAVVVPMPIHKAENLRMYYNLFCPSIPFNISLQYTLPTTPMNTAMERCISHA
jgi:tripeptidyl-peptidase I